MYICVHAIPNAKKEMIEIAWVNSYGQTVYKVKTFAPASDDKANIAITSMLATYLWKKKSNIILVKWHITREKLFYIS
jgi:uncharacterized protein YggU (UPF0235/DUF167 family)